MKEIVKMMYKARDYIQTKTDIVPNVGIVLGTGLGGLAKEIEADTVNPEHIGPGCTEDVQGPGYEQEIPDSLGDAEADILDKGDYTEGKRRDKDEEEGKGHEED